MTTLLATKNSEGKIVIGADRRVTHGTRKTINPLSKINKRNNVMLAHCGSLSLGSEILYSMPFTKFDPKKFTANYYAFEVFYDDLLAYLRKKGKMVGKSNRLNKDDTADIMLVVASKLFIVSITDEGILVNQEPLPCALGSGGDYAIGSFIAIDYIDVSHYYNEPLESRMTLAIKIAAKLDSGTDKHIDIKIED